MHEPEFEQQLSEEARQTTPHAVEEEIFVVPIDPHHGGTTHEDGFIVPTQLHGSHGGTAGEEVVVVPVGEERNDGVAPSHVDVVRGQDSLSEAGREIGRSASSTSASQEGSVAWALSLNQQAHAPTSGVDDNFRVNLRDENPGSPLAYASQEGALAQPGAVHSQAVDDSTSSAGVQSSSMNLQEPIQPGSATDTTLQGTTPSMQPNPQQDSAASPPASTSESGDDIMQQLSQDVEQDHEARMSVIDNMH
jgi:hypothetical protein